MNFINLTPELEKQWDEIAKDSDDAWLFHLYDWLKLSDEIWQLEQKSFLVEYEGELVGIFPLQLNKNKNALKSTEMGDAGAAVKNSIQGNLRKKILKAMYAHVEEIAKDLKIPRIEVYLPALSQNALKNRWGVNPLAPYFYKDISTHTFIIDLSQAENEFHSKLSDSTRSEIKKAKDAGYKITTITSLDEIDQYYELHLQTCERNNINPHPKEYFTGVFNSLCKNSYAVIWKACTSDGEPAAFEITAIFNNTAFYWSGCSQSEHLAKGVNYLLQSNAISWAKSKGCLWYDVGEAFFDTSDDKLKGLTLFKSKFQGELHRYFKGRLTLTESKESGIVVQWLRLTAQLLQRIFGAKNANFLINAIKKTFNFLATLKRWLTSFRRISFIKPCWGIKEYLNVITPCAANFDKKLVNEIQKLFNANAEIIPTSSGRTALTLGLNILRTKFPQKQNVIIPTYACKAIYDSVINAKLSVILADVNEDLNISSESVKRIIEKSDGILAIIVPHLGGAKADVENISLLAKEKDIFVIEDMAQSFGLKTPEGGLLGTKCDMSIFSFGIGKNLMATAGGLLMSNVFKEEVNKEAQNLGSEKNKHIRKRFFGYYAKYFLNCKYSDDNDIKSAYEYNRINPIDAKLALTQIKRLEFILERRALNAKNIIDALEKTTLQFSLQNKENNIYTKLSVIFTNKEDYSRLLGYFQKAGIQTEELYKPLHLREGVKYQQTIKLDNAERIYKYAFNIPARPNLSKKQIERIVKTVKNACSGRN